MGRFWVALAALAAAGFSAPAQAQTGSADLLACIRSADPGVRDPCVRKGLVSADADIRAAALAAAFRYRKNLVVSFESPQVVRDWQARVDQGSSTWGQAPSVARKARDMVEESGMVLNFAIMDFDAQTNAFKVTAMDDSFGGKKPNIGTGYVSGDTVQISSPYRPRGTGDAICGVELTLADGVEMRGAVACSGSSAMPRTNARMRIM